MLKNFDGGSTRAAIAIFRAAGFKFIGMRGEFVCTSRPENIAEGFFVYENFLGEKNFLVLKNFDGGSTRAAIAIFRAASFEFVGERVQFVCTSRPENIAEGFFVYENFLGEKNFLVLKNFDGG
ncbi:MAG: hypothetical protein IKN16_05340, partial [Selenomonadaceae bacterium]|nr:hypothetical protein [Selenomonadaceae bacterium]